MKIFINCVKNITYKIFKLKTKRGLMSKNHLNRREFLKISGLTLASGGFTGLNAASFLKEKMSDKIRQRVKNPFTKNGKPIVVVVEGNDIDKMLKKGFEKLGDLKKLTGTNEEIILKPNYVSPERYPVVTGTDTICSMIDIIRQTGSYKLTVADGSSTGMSTDAVYRRTGLKSEMDRRNVSTLDLHKCSAVTIKNPEWEYMDEVVIFDRIMEAPIVINMPTIKQHSTMGYTCSLKNLMGCQEQSNRRMLHRDYERDKYSRTEILKKMRLAIAEMAHAVNPELTVIDARKIMIKAHHFYGGGIVKEVNQLIISGDTVAADAYAEKLMIENNPNFSETWSKPTFERAQKFKLGIADLDKVEIIKVQV